MPFGALGALVLSIEGVVVGEPRYEANAFIVEMATDVIAHRLS